MAIKKQKTLLFTIIGGFICYCHALGSTLDWWQAPDASTPGTMPHYFNTGFLWYKRKGLLKVGDDGVL